LPGLIENRETLYFSWDCNPDFERMLLRTIYRMRRQKRRGTYPPTRLVDAGTILHEMRLHKGEEEVALLRRAAEVTAAGHLAAMRSVRPGMFEYEVEALVEHAFRSRGAIGPGYPSIVGGGANAVILHYIENRSPLRAGDLLLIDAGAEVEHYYTADVTRTFPISGRFSESQRQLYEIVLAAQKNAIATVRPGATMRDVHLRAVETITHGLLELGWLEGNLETSIEEEAYRPFYMHQTSHWLGMDVHDAGDYFRGGRERPLEAGMVLTVEPGLYVAPGSKGVDPRYHGIGIRIEDDVLVTPQGHEVLTSMIPKEIAEIESVMQRPAGEESCHSFLATS
ncbi:MAG: Xaa-Pro dipeptidase, partial [Deltaproteobacteria bacterium]